MTDYLISIIISTYNSEKFFREKLIDLTEQTIFNKCEIIIINSGSRENENLIAEEFLVKYKNIKYIRTKERESIYQAWNRGVKAATGKYITNSNTDDRLRNDAFEILVNYLEEHPEIFMIYADQYYSYAINEKFDAIKNPIKMLRPDFSYIHLLYRYILGSQPLWRNALHTNENIFFDEKYEVAGDYDFACRVAETHSIYHLKETLGSYYLSSGNKNKEYENKSRTLAETLEIHDIYRKRFWRRLSVRMRNRILFKIRMIEIIPNILYRLINKFLKMYLPSKHLPPQSYYSELKAKCYEK